MQAAVTTDRRRKAEVLHMGMATARCPACWFDSSWWEGQIGVAIATPDPVVSNLRIENWADIRDRMNFICDLFHTYHADAALFDAPYSLAQRETIDAGSVPGSPL